MARWVMIIDLRDCIGCGACQQVCHQSNKVPPGTKWRQVIEFDMDGHQKGRRLFLPISCMHCSNSSCLEVCPSGATYRRPDGIVDINYDYCVGCGACIVACPYHTRSIIFEDSISMKGGKNPKEAFAKGSDRIGVCTKCNFCLPRLDEGIARGLRPGVDPEATPSCVRYCLSGALHFGDLDDQASVVSRMVSENKHVRVTEELCTGPSIYYIYD